MRADKNLLLDEIKGQIDNKGSFVILSYEGLTANLANDFRKQVAGFGGNVEMVPKRVFIKAAEKAGVTLERSALPGHISFVFTGAQPFEATKTVLKYGKDKGNLFKILGGQFEGKLYSGQDFEKLSNLPSMDQLRAEFVGLLEAPMAHTVSTLEAVLSSIVTCLENKAKKDAAG